jgi:hypothetical protein
MASMTTGRYEGEQVDGRAISDVRALRQARDMVIVQMREGLPPFSRRHSWREIAAAVRVSHVAVLKRHRYLLAKHPKLVRVIRAGYMV